MFDTYTIIYYIYSITDGDILSWKFRNPRRWLTDSDSHESKLCQLLRRTAAAAGGIPARHLELGDPGTTIDAATARTELPPFEGPPQPVAGHQHEWGAGVARTADDAANAPEEAG